MEKKTAPVRLKLAAPLASPRPGPQGPHGNLVPHSQVSGRSQQVGIGKRLVPHIRYHGITEWEENVEVSSQVFLISSSQVRERPSSPHVQIPQSRSFFSSEEKSPKNIFFCGNEIRTFSRVWVNFFTSELIFSYAISSEWPWKFEPFRAFRWFCSWNIWKLFGVNYKKP